MFDGIIIGIEKNLFGVSWDFEGKKIVVVFGDGIVFVWLNDNGRFLYKFLGYCGMVNSVEFFLSKEFICKLNFYVFFFSCFEG